MVFASETMHGANDKVCATRPKEMPPVLPRLQPETDPEQASLEGART